MSVVTAHELVANAKKYPGANNEGLRLAAATQILQKLGETFYVAAAVYMAVEFRIVICSGEGERRHTPTEVIVAAPGLAKEITFST